MAQINKPSLYFNTKLYTGTGSSNSQSGLGFQPDWVWIKNRDTTGNHRMVNANSGSSELMSTNITNVGADSSYVSSFDSDGFTVGTATDTNNSGSNLVAWCWKAGGSGSANTDGATSSTVSVNTDAGISIVKFTGTGSATTVGHGLGVTPKVLLVKNISSAFDWDLGFETLGFTKKLKFTSSAIITDTGAFNDTAPTSSVFTVGNNSSSNGSGNTIVTYCFAEKKSFSKFGSYVGNGSTDGTFVYTGFKPAWVLLKNTTGDNWTLLDNKRDVDNPAAVRILPNLNFAEGSSNTIDFYSNGFKLLRTDAGENGSGVTYVYMAFAEQPLVGTNNIPATAR